MYSGSPLHLLCSQKSAPVSEKYQRESRAVTIRSQPCDTSSFSLSRHCARDDSQLSC